jgi:hypothetical protein
VKPQNRLVSHKRLREQMSEVISLREKVAQAEMIHDQTIEQARISAALSAVPSEKDRTRSPRGGSRLA